MGRSGNRTANATHWTAAMATKTKNKNVATMAVEPEKRKQQIMKKI